MRQQYGRYYDQQTKSDKKALNATPVSETGNTRREFLNRKYEREHGLEEAEEILKNTCYFYCEK